MDHLLSPNEVAHCLAEEIEQWRRGPLPDARIAGIGVAVPGLVRASDGFVRQAPHLGWIDEEIKERVERGTGIRTVVGNDASLAAHAEHLFGAAQGIDNVVYLNGGASGIGGGLVVHGLPVIGAGGYAGEFGQNRPGIADSSDRRGTGVLEDDVSRSRLLAALGIANADEPALATMLRRSPEPDVREEVQRQRRILATALANVVNVLNPSMVVLGGFLAMLAEDDLLALTHSVQAQSMDASGEDLIITTAALAEDRILIGAAEAAFADLLHDPLSGWLQAGVNG